MIVLGVLAWSPARRVNFRLPVDICRDGLEMVPAQSHKLNYAGSSPAPDPILRKAERLCFIFSYLFSPLVRGSAVPGSLTHLLP